MSLLRRPHFFFLVSPRLSDGDKVPVPVIKICLPLG